MKIPDHVCRGKRRQEERATALLKYLIRKLALQHTERGSMRALSEKVSLDHSTVAIYVRQGRFSQSAAERIVNSLGDPELKVSYLTEPLSLLAKSPG